MPPPPISVTNPVPASWRELVLPREHGSWSLALEPLALGLLAAPSWPGVALGVAALAAYFLRRPGKLAWTADTAASRTAALGWVVGLALLAAAALLVAVALGGAAPLALLGPAAVAGGLFASFDLRGAARAEAAEVAGAAAFALVPAGVAAFAGWSAPAAFALAAVMLARTVPTVLVVRAYLRVRKGERVSLAPSLLLSGAALAVTGVLAARGLAPWVAAIACGMLAVRAFVLLVWPRSGWRARQIGLFEAAVGGLFVIAVGLAWRA